MTERLEDLKARSKEVLMKVKPEVREKLIQFARTSQDPKTGRPSPTKAEKRALQSTKDADKALACWQLTVILRDFEEEFEKHVSDICQKSHQETISRRKRKTKPEEKEMQEKFKFDGKVVRDSLVRILEEEFGVPIKICYTCKHCLVGEYKEYNPFKISPAACYKNDAKVKAIDNGFNPPCETRDWIPEIYETCCQKCNRTVKIVRLIEHRDYEGRLIRWEGKCPRCRQTVYGHHR